MKKEKILYVTDLDGTLMRNDKSLSDYTIDSINKLIDEGMLITYATARSFQSAYEITRDIHFNLPVITRNGTVLADQIKKKEIEVLQFSAQDIKTLQKILQGKIEHLGFVTAYFKGKMAKSFKDGEISAGLRKYILEHSEDKRMRAISDRQDLFAGNVTYCTLIAEKAELQPIYEKIASAGDWECVFSKDTYSDEYWLEICPPNATKAKAVLSIKEKIGCNQIVVFGDSVNDLSMFAIANESFAVANGLDEVKAAATAIILNNEKDGVAKYLVEKWERQ